MTTQTNRFPTAEPIAESRWNPDASILTTRLSGTVDVATARRWKSSLGAALAGIPDGARFKLLVDLVNYEPADLDAHKEMREAVPLALAAHGFRPGFIDLVEGPELPIKTTRGIVCTAHANVHHDETKMTEYERGIGRPNERFFTSREEAESWIRALP